MRLVLNVMAVGTVAVFAVAMLTSEARPDRRLRVTDMVSNSSCGPDGRCTSPVSLSTSEQPESRLHTFNAQTSERKRSGRIVDANGNPMMVAVQTTYGFTITVHPAYANYERGSSTEAQQLVLPSRGPMFALVKSKSVRCESLCVLWAKSRTPISGTPPNWLIGVTLSDEDLERSNVIKPGHITRALNDRF